MICSRRRPVRRAMSTYGTAGGASRAVTTSSGVMFLRSRNVPCWRSPVSSRWVAMNTNARSSVMRSSSSRRVAMVPAVSPSRTVNSTWAGSVDAGVVSAAPRSSFTRSATNSMLQRRGIVRGPGQDGGVEQRPKGGQRDDEDEPRQHEREDEELDDAHDPAAAPTVTPARTTVVATTRRLVGLGDVLGRVGVGLVRVGMGCARTIRVARVTRASAGADRHEGISMVVGGRGEDEPGAAPCVEGILQDDGRSFTVHPGTVGIALRATRAGRPSGRAAWDPGVARRDDC